MRFTVPGKVRGKGRPRGVQIGGHVRFLTDAKTRVAEDTVRHFASEAMKGKPLFEGPLWLSVTIWQLHPQSWSKKRKATSVYVTGKPDCDNVLKLIGDALNGIVWRDDAQVASVEMVRRYILTDGQERVEIEVGELAALSHLRHPKDDELAWAKSAAAKLPYRVLPQDEVEAA